jgi:hypothetical protein
MSMKEISIDVFQVFVWAFAAFTIMFYNTNDISTAVKIIVLFMVLFQIKLKLKWEKWEK